MLTGVIFDYSVIFNEKNDEVLVDSLRQLLKNIKDAGLKIAVFSTNPFDIDDYLNSYEYPEIDLFLIRENVGVNKGKREWVDKVCEEWNCLPHNLTYIGDDKYQYRSARHSGTLYINADWIHPHWEGDDHYPAFTGYEPLAIWRFITHYLMTAPRWQFFIDGEKTDTHLRSLLYAGASLPASNVDLFSLQDIFTHEKTGIEVGGKPALKIIMNHAITSLYLEGLIPVNAVYCIYPSSTLDKVNPVIDSIVNPASKVFHGFPRKILLRLEAAKNTSLERVKGRTVYFEEQTNTVCLNPKSKQMIEGRSIIVFDDFTTSGMSLEWTRQLLTQAGANKVILMTVGKYPKGGNNHRTYTLPDENFSPYELQKFTQNQLTYRDIHYTENKDAPKIIEASFKYLKLSQELPSEYWYQHQFKK